MAEITITGPAARPDPKPASPSYFVGGPRVSPFDKVPETPSLRQEIEGNWELSLVDQGIYRLGEKYLNEPDPNFNPWDHLDGYELYADSLINARSYPEMQQMKTRIDSNMKTREMLARGEWGWIASLLSGVGDPVNLIPIPGAMGMGFLKGAARASAGNAALTAATAPLNLMADPTATAEEMLYSIGGAALFGAAFGGIAGAIGAKQRAASKAAFNRFAGAINEDDGMNIARTFDGKEEEYVVAWGNTRATRPDGVYEPVSIRDFEDIERTKQAADGQMYHYDDRLGWVLESDRGNPSPRSIPDEIRDELGIPAKIQKREMRVDDVALRAEYEGGKWRTELGDTAIRNADEYVTYRQIEANVRRQEPQLAGETAEAYRERVKTIALEDLGARRVPADVYSRTGLEKLVQMGNFSPVAKAGRMFKEDNILTDLPLQLGGDYGYALRANKAGQKTMPSVLVRQARHGAAAVEIKQAVDAAWLRYVQQNQAARGKTFMGLNVTASVEATKRSVKSMVGQKVITKAIFNQMAGRAVFEPEAFKVGDFDVVPEAREAAKAFTRVMQRYDLKARELGIYYDQAAVQKTLVQSEEMLGRMQRKLASWLWGGKQAPSRLQPAIKIGDQVFSGDTHEDALAKAMDALGPDVEVVSGSYGYVDNLATANPKPKSKLAPDPIQQERESYVAFIEANQAEFDRLQALEEQGIVDLEGSKFLAEMRDRIRMAEEAPAAANQNTLGNRAALGDPPKADAEPDPGFRTLDDVIASRVDSLSAKQRVAYDDMMADIAEVTERRDQAKAQLERAKSEPHTFKNQYGQTEPYFARFWHKARILERRKAFEKLLVHWYRRTQPIGAEERAAKTVDDMLRMDPGMDEDLGVPGLAHLHRRQLDVPNSFKVQDNEFGEISVSEFIELDMEMVGEAYTRNMGSKIEVAEMFGDTQLFSKMKEIKQHFRDRYLIPAIERNAPKSEIDNILAAREEYLGWIGLIRDGVMGGLRGKEVYNLSNRTARNLKSLQILSSMGRVLLTAAPEAMRVPMASGFTTAFRAMWTRLFVDLDKIKANVELSNQTAALFDMAIDRRHVEMMSVGMADPNGGGRWIDRKIEGLLPPFFRLTGLSPWTAMSKDVTMLATQHRIIDMARKLDDPQNVTNLAALGISKTDARMIARMPTEEINGLTLPAVNQWEGPDGRKARRLFLDALAGEAQRVIVTPSIADRSLLFSGVRASRGQKRAENDWYSVPLQFLSYGIAANQKVLLSGLQGRDHSAVMGAFAMLVAGVISNYLRTPSSAMMNKTYDELILEGYEASGLGGFWFSDLNSKIEQATRHTVGLRPWLGMDPRFGKTTEVGDYVDLLGPAPATYYDIYNAFTDPDYSATNRAQAIRRAIPYNNVIWWAGFSRDIATLTGKAFQ